MDKNERKTNLQDEIGANVISIQAGPHYGTTDDRLVIVLANYDTREDVPGVDDNGSGVAATLETARAISSLDRLYKRENTVLYVFADMKHVVWVKKKPKDVNLVIFWEPCVC